MASQHHIPVARRNDGRIVAGVAAGIGAHLGVDANVVRLAFVVLTLAGGLGLLLYGAGWFLMAPPAATEPAPRPDPDLVQAGALAAVVLGTMLLARVSGLWLGDAIVWPLTVAAIGIGLLWMRPVPHDDLPETASWPALDRLPPAASEAIVTIVGTRPGAVARAIVGGFLILGGIIVFIASAGSWAALWSGVVAALVVLTGLALVVGPGLWRLANALVEERRDRIRADERADMAAHLHDSVLQTLALVQRRADDPREVVRLARMQERELRGWLLAGREPGPNGAGQPENPDASLGEALEDVACGIEAEYGVEIEVVRVRDCPLAGLEPLLLGAREGMLNAARHSGADKIAVYLEVRDDAAVVFVRDRGRGFDPAEVPADRGGLAVSVVGRLTRHGGDALIRSKPETGTELELSLPRRARDNVS